MYQTDERNQLSFIITAGERERERDDNAGYYKDI